MKTQCQSNLIASWNMTNASEAQSKFSTTQSYTDENSENCSNLSENSSVIPVSVTSAIIGSTMTIVTMMGQILVFLVIYSDKRLQTPSNLYVISLASADFVISLLSMPVWTVTTTLNCWPLSQFLCDLWNSLDAAFCNISMHTILFISIERYRSVEDPIKYKINLTPKRMKIWLVGIWIGELVFWTAFIFLTQYLYGEVRDPLTCQVYWLNEPTMAVILVIMVFVLPVSATIIIYIMIYRISKRSGVMKVTKYTVRTNATIATAATDSETNAATNSGSHQSIPTITEHLDEQFNNKAQENKSHQPRDAKKRSKEDNKALRTIALLLITFAICWLPLGAVFISMGLIPGQVDILWLTMGFWLGYANSMLNLLCYSIGNPYFRETLKKLLS